MELGSPVPLCGRRRRNERSVEVPKARTRRSVERMGWAEALAGSVVLGNCNNFRPFPMTSPATRAGLAGRANGRAAPRGAGETINSADRGSGKESGPLGNNRSVLHNGRKYLKRAADRSLDHWVQAIGPSGRG